MAGEHLSFRRFQVRRLAFIKDRLDLIDGDFPGRLVGTLLHFHHHRSGADDLSGKDTLLRLDGVDRPAHAAQSEARHGRPD